MVSILDWSKFSRLQEAPVKTTKPATVQRYSRQREEDSIKQAEQHGYFINATESYLVEKCASATRQSPTKFTFIQKEVKKPDPDKLTRMPFLKLTDIHLRKIGDISFCTNLRICILHSNFLNKFDALVACRQLVKLDLHSNQITSIPGVAFWSSMKKLQFLHLHDNPLGKLEILNSLAACPSLMILTLHDTPISLKKNYRHHVVNSIWSLKALDRYVISDEEIIEDAEFREMFVAMHPALRIELCPLSQQDSTYRIERRVMNGVLSRLNSIQAHHSPVLILQRHIRGYLTRKYLSSRHTPYRLPSPVKSSLSGYIGTAEDAPPPNSPTVGITIPTDHTHVVTPLDLDQFIKHGSSTINGSDTPMSSCRQQILESIPADVLSHSDELSSHRDQFKKTRLLIDLSKLETNTLQALGEGPVTPTSVTREPSKEEISERKLRKKNPKPEKPKRIRDVKQFFGPVVEDVPSPEGMPADENSLEDELPLTRFRLEGYKPHLIVIDPTTEMLLSRRDAGRDIRLAEVEHHQKMMAIPKPHLPPQKRVNDDQRLFARVHGTMSMSCMFAVQQAYRDRNKSEKAAAKMEYILGLKEERDRAKQRIRLYREDKRHKALKERERDKHMIIDSLERRELHRLHYLEKRNESRNKSGEATKGRKADKGFISEFTHQHTSVSNALMRHDRQTMLDEKKVSMYDAVQGQKTAEKLQQETVQKYMKHRQLMRQTESAMMRAALDTRMLQDANDRLLQAKSRVAHLKAREATVQAFYPLPRVNSGQVTGSAPRAGNPQMTRWKTSLTTDGRLQGTV